MQLPTKQRVLSFVFKSPLRGPEPKSDCTRLASASMAVVRLLGFAVSVTGPEVPASANHRAPETPPRWGCREARGGRTCLPAGSAHGSPRARVRRRGKGTLRSTLSQIQPTDDKPRAAPVTETGVFLTVGSGPGSGWHYGENLHSILWGLVAFRD